MEKTKRIILDAMPKVKRFMDYTDIEEYKKLPLQERNPREYYIREMGFAFVSWAWIDPLINWLDGRKVLEVLAGKGAISYALQEKGVDVIATDNFSWGDKIPTWDETWTEVHDMDALEAIEKYGKDRDVVIMSWAPYQESIGYEVLKKYHEVNPNGILIGIDEARGGCIADNQFFDAAEELEDESFQAVVRNFESWDGIHDSPKLYRYNRERYLSIPYTQALRNIDSLLEGEIEKIDPSIHYYSDVQYANVLEHGCDFAIRLSKEERIEVEVRYNIPLRQLVFSCEKNGYYRSILLRENTEGQMARIEKELCAILFEVFNRYLKKK